MSEQNPSSAFPPPSFAPRRKGPRKVVKGESQAQATPPSYAPAPAQVPPSYAPARSRAEHSPNYEAAAYGADSSGFSSSGFSSSGNGSSPAGTTQYVPQYAAYAPEQYPPAQYTPAQHLSGQSAPYASAQDPQGHYAQNQFAPVNGYAAGGGYDRASQYTDPNQPYDPNWERKQLREERKAQKLKKRKRVKRATLSVFTLVLAFLLLWPMYLYHLANSQIVRLEALSETTNTSGETWLIAGSDTRIETTGEGEMEAWGGSGRADTLMLVRSVGGKSEIVSLPRDTAVLIPGREEEGLDKLNASYYYGGPKLLIATVEKIIGTKVDHYVQVSMTAVPKLVDAVGTINLCYDYPVQDPEADLNWPGGCHDSDGKTALAFARTRKYDPLGDFGRQERQRQVISKLIGALNTTSTYVNPFRQYDLTNAAAQNLAVDNQSNLFKLVFLAWTYKNANAAGLSGVPPIADADYYGGGHGSKVLLSEEEGIRFWQAFREGNLSPEMYHQFATG